MGIRTGQQYLDKLNAMTPHVVIDGEVVNKEVAEHPAFRNVARSYAKLFDMQHDPKYQEALTYTSPSTGDLVNASFLVPRTIEDLQRRRRAISTWAESSNGFLGRSGDYMNSCAHRAQHGREVVLAGGPEIWREHPQLLRVGPGERRPGHAHPHPAAGEPLGLRLGTARRPALGPDRGGARGRDRHPRRADARHHRPDRRRAPRLPVHGPPRHAGRRALLLRLRHPQRCPGPALPVPHLALQRRQHPRRAAGLPL